MGQALKPLYTSSLYLIDSFPVAVCRNISIPHSRLLQGKAYRGYSVSKREYFYGFKVQVIITLEGLPVEYLIGAGEYPDITAFQAMHLNLLSGSVLYGDSGYTDYEQEDLYQASEQVCLQIQRKKNSHRQDHPAQAFLKQFYHRKIKTVFS